MSMCIRRCHICTEASQLINHGDAARVKIAAVATLLLLGAHAWNRSRRGQRSSFVSDTHVVVQQSKERLVTIVFVGGDTLVSFKYIDATSFDDNIVGQLSATCKLDSDHTYMLVNHIPNSLYYPPCLEGIDDAVTSHGITTFTVILTCRWKVMALTWRQEINNAEAVKAAAESGAESRTREARSACDGLAHLQRRAALRAGI